MNVDRACQPSGKAIPKSSAFEKEPWRETEDAEGVPENGSVTGASDINVIAPPGQLEGVCRETELRVKPVEVTDPEPMVAPYAP